MHKRLEELNSRVISLDNRVGNLEISISSLDNRFGNLENSVNNLDNRVCKLEEAIKELSSSVASGFKKIEDNFSVIIGKILFMERKIENIDAVLKEIRGNSSASLETVEHKITGLTDEISKINCVTNYEDHFSNLKIVSRKK